MRRNFKYDREWQIEPFEDETPPVYRERSDMHFPAIEVQLDEREADSLENRVVYQFETQEFLLDGTHGVVELFFGFTIGLMDTVPVMIGSGGILLVRSVIEYLEIVEVIEEELPDLFAESGRDINIFTVRRAHC